MKYGWKKNKPWASFQFLCLFFFCLANYLKRRVCVCVCICEENINWNKCLLYKLCISINHLIHRQQPMKQHVKVQQLFLFNAIDHQLKIKKVLTLRAKQGTMALLFSYFHIIIISNKIIEIKSGTWSSARSWNDNYNKIKTTRRWNRMELELEMELIFKWKKD